MDLCNPKIIKEIMGDAKICFRHDLGQNFLINSAVPERIAEECTDYEDSVILEIGPGIGCLTSELAQRYKKVIAVEIDSGLIPVLGRTLAEYENVEIINSDIMKLDLQSVISDRADGERVSVCANLPYYITTPILMHLLECGVKFSSITVMVQSEVASRLCAAPGSADYGAITVSLGYYGEARKLFSVPAGCFMPAPKVNSSVVRIDIFDEPKYRPKNEKMFFGIVRAAFDMRRKTLVNAISAKYPAIVKSTVANALNSMGLSENVRGERLSTKEFVELSDILSE